MMIGLGEDNFADLVPWLLDTMKSDAGNDILIAKFVAKLV